MRRATLLLLLCLSVQLFAEKKPTETKVLIPVVATEAGKPVLDLQTANFSVQGANGIQLDSAQMVPAEALNDPNHTFPVFILYDAFLLPAPVQDAYGEALLSFLGEVAEKHSPVTLIVNTPDGLKLVYNFGTNPKILADALSAMNQKAAPHDPEVAKQVERLKILKTWVKSPMSTDMVTALQMDGLNHIAQVLGRSPTRKALLWMTWNYMFGTGNYTTHWLGSAAGPSHQLDSGASGNEASWLAANTTDERFANLPPLYQRSIDALNAAHTSIYPLQMFDRRKNTLAIDNRMESYTQQGLMQVASCTGGVSIKDYQQTSIAQAVADIQADFGPYYMLTASSNNIKRTDWIPLKIAVTKPGVTVRTTPGFLGLSPSAAKAAAKW